MRNRVSRRETLRVLCLLPSQAQEHSWFSQPPQGNRVWFFLLCPLLQLVLWPNCFQGGM